MDDLLWLALSKVNGLGIKKLMALYQYNSNLTVNDLTSRGNYNELKQVVKSTEVADRLQDIPYITSLIESAKQQIALHEQKGIKVIPFVSKKYPKLLRLIPDPPVALYCKGNIDALQIEENIAIIGTRNPTETGIKVARKIAYMFSKRGYTIVSGLALGIDTVGHQGALDAKGITIAVMAGGLDKIYPRENNNLADDIVRNNGLLVSEYAIGTPMQRSSFVKRDRIQSGLSLGICPVQTDVDGGSMHTVRFANDQKRVLFCPKILEDENLPVYRGITKVIRDYNAPILENEQDYDKIIKILKDNINQAFPNFNKQNSFILDNKNIKKAIVKTTSPQQFELDIFSYNYEKEDSHFVKTESNEIISFILEAKQLLKKNNLSQEQFIDMVKKLWNEVP